MTHEEIKILVSAYADGEVTPSEKTIVQEHLSTCESCQKDYKMYMAISSSLSKWPDESLSPDEEIKVQKRFEQRRDPMLSNRTLMALGTTLALTIIIGSVVQVQLKKGQVQGRLKSAADDIGSQYTDAYTRKSYLAMPAMAGNMMAAPMLQNERLGAGLISSGPMIRARAYPTYAKAPLNTEHKVIKNADITLKVPDAQKAQSQLDGIITKFKGIVINFEINRSDDGSRNGLLVFNVLPKNLKDILSEIRKLGEVQSENQSGEDITDQYDYLQTRLADYEADRDRLQKILAKNANNVDSNLYVGSQLENVQANINGLENSIKRLDDQAYMATVVVHFYDTVLPVVVKPVSLKDRFISTFKDEFRSTLETSYEIAINSFSGIVIVLSFLFQVVIWSLIIWGVYLLIRLISKK
jgi:Domain of unknown function (DUF4349)/Putative zinc-finger